MEFDLEERFRLDPGEDQLTDELQTEAALAPLEQENLELEAMQQPAPTGAQQPSPAPSTQMTPTGVTPEELERQAKIKSLQKVNDPRYWAEKYAAIPTGVVDFAVDVANLIPGVQLPKIQQFEYQETEAVRGLAAIIVPTMAIGGGLGMVGKAANTRVGWSLGNSKFIQWMGERGVEGLAGLTVGAISSEYEEDNATGTLKKAFPKTMDFIPDSVATLDSDSPDIKRQKNIREDVGLGFTTDLVLGGARFLSAITGNFFASRRSTRLVGETAEARKWLDEASPKPLSDDPEEIVVQSAIKREEALDEVGQYGYATSTNPDLAIKGVHDVYDYTEIGVRTVDDFGVVGAAIDSARIARNAGSVNGRLGSIISDPALKYSLTNGDAAQDVVLGLADQLKKAGPVGAEGANWKVTFDDVMDANEDLAIDLFDPRMSKADVRQILEPFITRNADGKEIMAEGGFAMAAKALRGFGEDLTSMDVARAQSLLAGSLSGRIADVSEGARLMDGTAAVKEAQDKIIDMMQYVSQLSGSAKYYKNRKMNLIQMVKNGFRNIEGYNEATAMSAGDVAQKIFKDSEKFASTMRTIAENQPDLMKQFLMAYELTDGRIDTIAKMNHYIHGMTSDLGKAIINLDPEVENKLVKGVFSILYNNVLSAFKTPIQALVGNFGGIISQPISHFGGALAKLDFEAIQRGWIAYSSVGDTLRQALPYAGDVFMKASREPDSVRAVTRTDLLLQSEAEMAFLKEAARVQTEQGNIGLEYLVNQIELLSDLSKDPILRFGPNAMVALDGFTGVFNAAAEARFRAMDELRATGKAITKENVKPIADKYYRKMFDENGMLSDEAVKYATNEIALNLDTPIARTVSQIANQIPALKTFLWFPTSGMNMIDMGGKYNPFYTPFQRDINELANTKLSDLLADEDRIDELLRNRNIDPTKMDAQSKAARIADLKYTTKGRKAMGMLAVLSAGTLMTADRITGDGLYDREAQRVREKQSNWKPRSIKGLDGKWYSYASLGPLADWLAFTVNVMDNFDTLGAARTEHFMQKSAFILGASITDRTGLSSLKPLMDMLSQNEGAFTRWAGGMINNLGPLAGARGEWSRIFSQGLQEVNDDLMAVIGNRNRFASEFNPSNRAPYVYNPVTGKKANGYGFLQRLWNSTNILQIHDGQSEEEKFLQEIEFDQSTTFMTKNGIKLTADERSELFRIMGEQGIWRRGIREIMLDAKDWKSIVRLRKLRGQGVRSDDVALAKWDRIHVRLSEARRAAEQEAFNELDSEMADGIRFRQMEQLLKQEAVEQGEYIELDESLNIRR